jgi:hypothetical protein
MSTQTELLKRLTSGGIKGLRSYLVLPTDREVKLYFDGIATDVSGLTGLQSTDEEDVYTLSGTRVTRQPAQKGIYIQRSKKMIIK